jgi:exosortase
LHSACPSFRGNSIFPFFLFSFGVPLGNKGDAVTQPLRQLATDITAAIAQGPLGIKVIQNGTTIFDPTGKFSYEIAAACSGLRSLTAITVVAIIFAFVWFKTWWQRAIMMGAAIPLAIGSNVFRLSSIIVAAEAFGQDAGNFVHDSSWLSLLPYLPAFVGLALLGWLLDGRWRGFVKRLREREEEVSE